MVPILQIPNQLLSISQDFLDFDIVPTLSINRRVLVLKNLSSNVVEYIVDESTCVLCMEGLLSVQPSYGNHLKL